MLIDTSYFEADLAVGQITDQAVAAAMNLFIKKYEEEYLMSLLGYPLYKAFMAGLMVNPIDQKWLDLINGKEYTYNGRLSKWEGFIHQMGTEVNAVVANPFTIVVGRGQQYDPVPGTTTTIPPAFVDIPFVFMQRGFGPLRSDEFSVAGSLLTLLGGYTFNDGDTYFYFSDGQFSVNTGTGEKRSPIANYVYFKYQKDNASFTVGAGERKPKSSFSVNVSPGIKMIRAWNEMVKWNREFIEFMESNRGVYPEYDNYPTDWRRRFLLQPINQFGI